MSVSTCSDPMKCKNPRYDNPSFVFHCPHCNEGLNADQSLLNTVWAQYNGIIPCAAANCGKEITVPTLEEMAAMMSGAAAPNTAAPVVDATPPDEPVTDSTPTDQTATEVVEAKSAIAAPVPAPAPVPEVAATKPASEPQIGQAAQSQQGDDKKREATDSGTAPLNIKHGFGAASPVTLDQEARGGELTIHTIRHSECLKGEKDKFDETVTEFLRSQGEDNIITVSPIQYSNGEKQTVDYGVIIYYKTS